MSTDDLNADLVIAQVDVAELRARVVSLEDENERLKAKLRTSRLRAWAWRKAAKAHFRSRAGAARLARALAIAEEVLHHEIEHAKPGCAHVSMKLALDAIQPFAITHNPELAGKRSSLVELLARDGGADLKVRFPGWAMRRITDSLADTLRDAPNYVTATAVFPHDEERYEVVVRRIGKGRTAHELRAEAEARAAEAEGRAQIAEERAFILGRELAEQGRGQARWKARYRERTRIHFRKVRAALERQGKVIETRTQERDAARSHLQSILTYTEGRRWNYLVDTIAKMAACALGGAP